MKTKPSLFASLIAAASLTGLSHASPPDQQPAPSAEAQAMLKVRTEIYQKVAAPPESRFSRVAPVSRDTLEFQPQLLVNGETRLPFSITPRKAYEKPAEAPSLQGYIRVSDREIFLRIPGTATYRPASQDPRFAPAPPPPATGEVPKPT